MKRTMLMVVTWTEQKEMSMRRVPLVLLISVAALLPAMVFGEGGRTFTHTYTFGIDTSGSDRSVMLQGSLHLDADCGAVADGTLRLRDSDDAEPTVYEATAGTATATCADTDGDGKAELTEFTMEFVPVQGTNLATLNLSSCTCGSHGPGTYPITFRIEGEDITPLFAEGTLRVTGSVSNDQTR